MNIKLTNEELNIVYYNLSKKVSIDVILTDQFEQNGLEVTKLDITCQGNIVGKVGKVYKEDKSKIDLYLDDEFIKTLLLK